MLRLYMYIYIYIYIYIQDELSKVNELSTYKNKSYIILNR